jgi:invasion protein IalB
MREIFQTTILSAALAAALPIAAWAQETQTTEETAPSEGAAPAAEIESQLSLGEDASGPQLGEAYTQEVLGDWEIRCIKTDQEADPCQMYQLMDDGDGNAVAEFSMFRLPDGGKAKAGAIVVVPLETALQAQVTISVDGANARRYPYSFCNPVGCYSRIGFTEPEVAGFRKGNVATIQIVPALAPDQKINLTLSLKGFTAAYNKASQIDP